MFTFQINIFLCLGVIHLFEIVFNTEVLMIVITLILSAEYTERNQRILS